MGIDQTEYNNIRNHVMRHISAEQTMPWEGDLALTTPGLNLQSTERMGYYLRTYQDGRVGEARDRKLTASQVRKSLSGAMDSTTHEHGTAPDNTPELCMLLQILKGLLADLVRKGWNATRFMEGSRRLIDPTV